jgi:hypothetical protein
MVAVGDSMPGVGETAAQRLREKGIGTPSEAIAEAAGPS